MYYTPTKFWRLVAKKVGGTNLMGDSLTRTQSPRYICNFDMSNGNRGHHVLMTSKRSVGFDGRSTPNNTPKQTPTLPLGGAPLVAMGLIPLRVWDSYHQQLDTESSRTSPLLWAVVSGGVSRRGGVRLTATGLPIIPNTSPKKTMRLLFFCAKAPAARPVQLQLPTCGLRSRRATTLVSKRSVSSPRSHPVWSRTPGVDFAKAGLVAATDWPKK